MRRRGRVLRIAKWAGLVVCMLIAITWIHVFSIGKALYSCTPLTNDTVIWSFSGEALILGVRYGTTWWGFGYLTENPNFFEYLLKLGPTGLQAGYGLRIPVWMFLAGFALPTAFLWHFDRRHTAPGHCKKCGYDLTGNVSGVCPECGQGV